jgi:hypothetical protein
MLHGVHAEATWEREVNNETRLAWDLMRFDAHWLAASCVGSSLGGERPRGNLSQQQRIYFLRTQREHPQPVGGTDSDRNTHWMSKDVGFANQPHGAHTPLDNLLDYPF